MKYIVVILLTILFLGAASTYISPKKDEEVSKSPKPTATPMPPQPTPIDNRPKSIIKEVSNQNYDLVNISPYNLSLGKPKNWTILPESYNEQENNGQKIYFGSVTITNSKNSQKLIIMLNHQGDFCPGPVAPKQETVANRFGLPGIKIFCGKTVYYLYSERGSGSVFRNVVLVSVVNPSSEESEIINSIQYTP